MENFKPKSLSEMNAEFAQKLAQQIEEKQKNEEAQEAAAQPVEEVLQEDDSMMFDGFDFSALDDDEDEEEEESFVAQEDVAPQEPETEKSINLFEDVKLPVFEKKAEEKIEVEPSKEEEATEPDPKGFFGPPIEKTYKKEQKPKIEPTFDFEKTPDYSGTQLKKSFKPKKKKSKAAKGLVNTAIIIVVILSLVVGVACFATAQPGRFLFGRGLLICENTVEQAEITEGTLLFVRAAASAADNEVVAVYKDSMAEYEFVSSNDVSFKDTVFAVAKREIPFVGKILSFVNAKWIIFAGAAAALFVILIIIRIVAFRNDKDLIIGETPKRRGKKQVLDF
ncbi:MAG: hypothetical protein IJF40_03735 [Clostridia bacterium]|nr:hypothetical protein [Clostridia bacterium]